ncbi:MAG: hypothetical protein ACLTSX_10150 [Collinsella sp.]
MLQCGGRTACTTCGMCSHTVYCCTHEIAEVERVRCDVRVDGAAAGRTYRCDEGREVTLVTHADPERFYALVDELAMSAAPAAVPQRID